MWISPANPGPIRADAAGLVPLPLLAWKTTIARWRHLPPNDHGRFLASLAPGHYKASLKGRKSSIGGFGPFDGDVVAGKMTNVQWECDSGNSINSLNV